MHTLSITNPKPLAQRRHRVSGAAEKENVEQSWTEQDDRLVQQMALSPKVNGLELPFPRPFMYHAVHKQPQTSPVSNVYNVGHHNERSFGATPYLVQAKVKGKLVWFLVDTPKFGKSAVEAVTSITGEQGPDYLFLTHIDDTADHDKWVEEFPNLQRIFHQGDTGRHNWLRDRKLDHEVEILLPQPDSPPEFTPEHPLHAYSIDGTPLPPDWYRDFLKDTDNDVVIVHTPGHSPGSITLWKKPTGEEPGILFTGDHYAYTTRTGRMSGFPRYGNNLQLQAKSLQNLLYLDWDVVAPGHGHPRDYSSELNKDDLKRKELEEALVDLKK
jgi:glyoxylase-like metal-dependent hydrolase (beta-lactamase superfamily II)